MKVIYLLRHAKSSWKDPELDDLRRPLNKRGRQTAVAIARFLTAEGIVPATILCSPSVRTRETLDAISASFAEPVPTRFEQGIYEAHVVELLQRLQRLNNHLASVMVVGHNPGLELLTNVLTGAGQGNSGSRNTASYGEKFATGSLAVIEADIDTWADLKETTGRLVRFVRGRDLLADTDD